MDKKTCNICGDEKPLADFSFVKSRQRHMNYCKSCNNEKYKEYRQSDKRVKYRKEYQSAPKYKRMLKAYRQSDHGKQKHRLGERARRAKIKFEVLSKYSGGEPRCCKCQFADIRALTIDHVDGGGTKHRKEVRTTSGHTFYLWLKNQKWPTGFQVLCMNCQFIKRHDNNEFANFIPTTSPSPPDGESSTHPDTAAS